MSSKFLIALSPAFILFLLQGNGTPASAHAYPTVSSPADGTSLKEPPREVRIQFTEGLELAFSQITVKGPNGEIVSQGKLRQPAQDTLAVDLKTLSPGNYLVEWQVLSVDTHITEGVLRFSLAPKGK
jgi:methionine-rich copper-binding protein CopC